MPSKDHPPAIAQKRKNKKMAHPLAGHRLLKKEKKGRSALEHSFGILFAMAILLGGFALFLSLGLDSFRPQLGAALSRVAGRTVRLDGRIGLGVIWGQGIKLSAENVSIENPSWARRASFARIGQFDIGIALRPLFDRRVEIFSFTLQNADVEFEKGENNKINWGFGGRAKGQPKTTSPDPIQSVGWSYVLRAKSAKIEKSRLSFVKTDGSTTPVYAEKLEIAPLGEKIDLHFVGVVSDIPVRMDLKGGALEDVLADLWPFEADVQYGRLVGHVEGVLQDSAKKIIVSRSRIASRDSNFSATVDADLTQDRPMIKGEISGGHVTLRDFELPSSSKDDDAENETPIVRTASQTESFFGTEEINLSPLLPFDLDLVINLNALGVGLTKFDAFKAKLMVEDGKLLMSPMSGYLGDSRVEAQIKLDASSKPAHYALLFNAQKIDLSQLYLVAGLNGFLTGKVDFDLDLTAQGNSQREMATTANGAINLKGVGGTISGKMLGDIQKMIMSALMPGQTVKDVTNMNCIAMRLTVKNGFLAGDGLAMETPYAVIYGSGFSDLHSEKLEYRLDTIFKSVGLTTALPPLFIEGSWGSPVYKTDPAAGAKALWSSVTNKISEIKDGKVLSFHPPVNASSCVGILDRKGFAASLPSPVATPASAFKKPKGAIEKLGNTLLKGLGQQFLGGQ